jgi:hypothetical protein
MVMLRPNQINNEQKPVSNHVDRGGCIQGQASAAGIRRTRILALMQYAPHRSIAPPCDTIAG